MLLHCIRTDGGTQPRAAIRDELIDEYRLDMLAGATFPPVIVFYDGSEYWLADGFHRFYAAQQLGQTELDADVRQGTRRDAVLYSVGANAAHGLRRTNEDKRRAVMTLLNDEEWGLWSDREIAEKCGVGHAFVSNLRNENVSVYSGQIERTVERNGTTYTMNTVNIGHNNGEDRWYPAGGGFRNAATGEWLQPPRNSIETDTGEILSGDASPTIPFEEPQEPSKDEPAMPTKPAYHAGNRSVGDQFHSKLIWNYTRLHLAETYHEFTIGYSQRSWDQFLELLTLAHIDVLMDVRRSASSQYRPEFSRNSLQALCARADIQYIHAPELGVDYEDRADLGETHDYQALFESYEARLSPTVIVETIHRRLALLNERADKPLHTAYMCVEIDPNTCHRSRIAAALVEILGVEVFDL